MAGHPLEIRVDCLSGYRGEETPRRLVMGERRIEVLEVTDRWLSPGHRYFKVLGDDSATYIIRHDAESDVWELAFYQLRQGP